VTRPHADRRPRAALPDQSDCRPRPPAARMTEMVGGRGRAASAAGLARHGRPVPDHCGGACYFSSCAAIFSQARRPFTECMQAGGLPSSTILVLVVAPRQLCWLRMIYNAIRNAISNAIQCVRFWRTCCRHSATCIAASSTILKAIVAKGKEHLLSTRACRGLPKSACDSHSTAAKVHAQRHCSTHVLAQLWSGQASFADCLQSTCRPPQRQQCNNTACIAAQTPPCAAAMHCLCMCSSKSSACDVQRQKAVHVMCSSQNTAAPRVPRDSSTQYW